MTITFTNRGVKDPATGRFLRLTGLTLSRQYARLIDFFGGDWRRADKVQNKFNRRFPAAKRRKFWNPGHVIQ